VPIRAGSYNGELGYAAVAVKGGSELYKTTDGGGSWHKIRDIGKEDFGVSVLPDRSIVITVSSNQQSLLRSTNDGSTFVPLNPAGPNHELTSTSTGAFVGVQLGPNDSIASFVANDGATFVPVPTPPIGS